MKVLQLKQKWEGFLTYLDGYEDVEFYKDVNFSMEIELEKKSFTGFSVDAESKDVFKKPAKVKGFFDNDKISFVMKYPCYYYKDDNSKIVLDLKSEHPDIHYLGFFNDKKDSVSGNWEMTIYQEKHLDGYLEETLSGSFEMRLMK